MNFGHINTDIRSVIFTIAFVIFFKQHEAEAEEAEMESKKLGLDGDSSLKALIQKKQQSREEAANDFFSQLEAKYAKPKKNSAKSKRKK